MRRGTTARRAVSGLVAVAFVIGSAGGLTGCTADPPPSPQPTVAEEVASPPAAPTATPTPVQAPDAAIEPERPTAMDAAGSAGAEAAAEYYLQLFPYVYATNDLAEWRTLGHPECIFCADVIRQVEEHAASGIRAVGGLIDISRVTTLEVEPGRWWSVGIEMSQGPSQDLDSSGQLVHDFPERKPYHVELALTFDDGHWVVREISYERTDG